MKKWTQAEVDAVQPDENGWRNFPTGDYTQIQSFGECCSFGKRCRFGEWCSFENEQITNGRYIAIDRIGSEKRKTYFFRGDEGLFVRAGCWFSDMESFRERVKNAHGGTRHEREYLMACDLAEMMLSD